MRLVCSLTIVLMWWHDSKQDQHAKTSAKQEPLLCSLLCGIYTAVHCHISSLYSFDLISLHRVLLAATTSIYPPPLAYSISILAPAPTFGEDGKTAAVLTLGRGDANLAAAELYRRLGFQPMPEELFVDPDDLSVLGKGNLVMSSTDW